MAQQFLDQLPKAQSGELPNGAECMICKEEYGTVPSDNGVVEHAVLLPCLHHVGSECIAVWLSPETRVGNSCPMCRAVLLPAQLLDHDEEDEDEDYEGEYSDEYDEGDEEESEEGNGDEDGEDGDRPEEPEDRTDGGEQLSMTLLAAYQNARSPPPNTSTREDIEGQDDRQWFERWPLPTSQQIEDSEKRARQALLRPPPSGFMNRILLQTYSPPADLESKVAELASAYQTMAFRETLLYLNLQKAGARIPPLESPHKGLSAQQEEVLLWELGQRGAFSGTHVRPGHMAMTNRESWYVHSLKQATVDE